MNEHIDDGHAEHVQAMRATSDDLGKLLVTAYSETAKAANAVREALMELDRHSRQVEGELSAEERRDLRAHVDTATRELRAANRIIGIWTTELDDIDV